MQRRLASVDTNGTVALPSLSGTQEMCSATRVRRHLLAFIALSSFASAELPSVNDTALGTWSYADVTVLSTDFATSLGAPTCLHL